MWQQLEFASKLECDIQDTPFKYWVGVQQGQSYLMGSSLALVGNPSSDGVTIKMPYGVDVLH